MTDRYQAFTQSALGRLLVKNLGLPNPVPLLRYTEGDPMVSGTVLTGGRGRLVERLPRMLVDLGVTSRGEADPEEPGDTDSDGRVRYRGLVLDATGITDSSELGRLRDLERLLVIEQVGLQERSATAPVPDEDAPEIPEVTLQLTIRVFTATAPADAVTTS